MATITTMNVQTAQNDLIREILNIEDIHLLDKVMKLIRREEKKQATLAEPADDSYRPATKAEILAGFEQACQELKMNLEGKLELRNAEELLDEL